jgi:DnaA-homolog protein
VTQLALPIGLADHAVFASFYPAGNETAVLHLETVAAGTAIGGAWLTGPAGSGKSHLLQASCAAAGDAAVYLPLRVLAEAGPRLLEGLDSRRLVALDDIEALAGEADWEQALFGLYNELQAEGGQLLVAAPSPPRECAFALADLSSRMMQLPIFALRGLGDPERVAALQLRAGQRGLELPPDTARYLLTRERRDMGSLQALLDRLDREALRAQRRLTVPFVREVLGGGD